MPVAAIIGALPAEHRGLGFLGMVLNNHVTPIDQLALVRATIEYYRNGDLQRPLKKLFKVGLPIAVEDLARYEPPPGAPVQDDVATHCVLVQGRNTHWLVPPGRQITRTRYSGFLPEGVASGTVHYAVVHLHNYGTRLRLTDLTSGKMLWETRVEYEPSRVQIERIPVYSSVEGFRIYADHTYEVEAHYENTSDVDVDAMALIDLYYHPDGDITITYLEPPAPPV
jgi:hypothetical protein